MGNFAKNEYINLPDEELVKMVRAGDDVAFKHLYEKYLPKIRTMTYSFQGLGLDLEDLVQEATVGFYTAINVFDFKSSSFSTFCYICMRRLLMSILKQSNRKKAVPQSAVIFADDSFFEIFTSPSPEQEYIAKEDFSRLKSRIETELSVKERDVLYLYISGLNYKEIAEKLGVERKFVDNALQRIRKKLC